MVIVCTQILFYREIQRGFPIFLFKEEHIMKTANLISRENKTTFLSTLAALSEDQFEKQGLIAEFPREIAKLKEEDLAERPCSNRLDLRALTAFTIDCSDTKDMDDAVSLSFDEERQLYHLGVHIADVSAYVTPGTKLDHVAQERGTSVYLPHRTIPMLPPVLSDNLCSLNPGVDRNCISVLMDLDTEGNLVDFYITKSKIQSRIKGSYEDINAILDEKASSYILHLYEEEYESIVMMDHLAGILRERRRLSGATLNECGEAKILFDNDTVTLEADAHGHAEHLIEEFMVLANNTVASYFIENDLPGIYRTQNLRNSLAKYEPAVSHHAELCLEQYAHFTSPIRRLADLRIHQVLTMHLAGCSSEVLHYMFDQLLVESCEYANKRSRRADALQKHISKKCYIEYFKEHPEDIYTGRVTGFTRIGAPIITLDGINIKATAAVYAYLQPGDRIICTIKTSEDNIMVRKYRAA